MNTLRPYQTELLERVRAAFRQGFHRPCLVLPCGGGKSCLIAEMTKGAVEKGGAVLLLVHRQELVAQLRLSQDQTFTVTTPEGGENLIMVQDGSIAVTEASCPDHYCVRRGFCQGGREIVCLPNRLVIRFVTEGEVDGETG